MTRQPPLNLFYEEPDPDRWIPFDRHPRRLIRRLARGPNNPGGAGRVFLNLMAGLDRIGAAYRVNDYRHLEAHPDELACVVGKPHVLDKIPGNTPLLFGTSIYSHPNDAPGLLDQRVIRQILVPSPWVKRMFAEVWRDIVTVWPVGIDTVRWAPDPTVTKDIDILIYDKVGWQREHYERTLIEPLKVELRHRKLRVKTIRYGRYREKELLALSKRARAMVYLSRHETQGIAAEQIMASDVPLFAWDRGGFWQDPKYYPQHVKFSPVTSVPYWDDRCGIKFEGEGDLLTSLDTFWQGIERGAFSPRQMILERLTLEKQAQEYLRIAKIFS